jgi:hypothetical protein
MGLVGSAVSSDSKFKIFIGGLLIFVSSGNGIWIVLVMLALSTEYDIRIAFFKFISQFSSD